MIKQWLSGELSSTHEFFRRSTSALEEAGSGFPPAEGVFSVAAQVAHAAQTIDGFVAAGRHAIVGHTAHHRGALTVYARLLGKTPPMPYMDV